MTLKDVQDRVAAIRTRFTSDRDYHDEDAHEEEDAIHQDVLRAIAKGETDCAASILAEAALETKTIPFERWYA